MTASTRSGVLTLRATTAEGEAGLLQPDRLAAAATALWDDGVVILTGLVALDKIAILRSKMEADIPQLLARVGNNLAPGHHHHAPPIGAPYVFAELLANPIAIQVVAAVIGSSLQLAFVGGNTNMPGSRAQPLHRDIGNQWPDADYTHRPASITVNVPLVDIDETNGSMEVWPGTHRLAHVGPVPYDDASRAARAAIAPAVQLACPAGGIIVRDHRGWHRGMPNKSDRPRLMLALVYSADWMRCSPVPFHRSAMPTLANFQLGTDVVVVDESFDYLEDWKVRRDREAGTRR